MHFGIKGSSREVICCISATAMPIDTLKNIWSDAELKINPVCLQERGAGQDGHFSGDEETHGGSFGMRTFHRPLLSRNH